MRWYVVLAAVLASLLAACGGGTSDETALKKAIEEFFQSSVADPPKAYTYLAQECKDEIAFPEFAVGRFFFGGLLGDRKPEVKELKILEHGEDAIVANFEIVLVVDGEEFPLSANEEDDGPTRFVKENGRWRFADCEDFSLTGGFSETEIEVVPAIPDTQSRFSEGSTVEADDDPFLPGEYVNLPEIYGGFYGNRDGPNTAAHVRRDIDYVGDGNSNPPAGGPHWGSAACGSVPEEAPSFCGPAPWGTYRTPWEPETLIHNMEHAGVVLWYNTADQSVIEELENLIADRLRDGQLLVMTPYPDMEAETVALTAWSRIDKFPVSEYTRQRVEEFIDVHERRFNPEGF